MMFLFFSLSVPPPSSLFGCFVCTGDFCSRFELGFVSTDLIFDFALRVHAESANS